MEAQDGARLLMEVAWFTMAGTLATVLIGAQTTLVPLWLGVPVGISGYGLRRFFVPQSAPPATARLFTVGTGVAVLYVAIALLPGIDLDFAWPLRFSEDWQASRHVVVGGLLIIVLWLRGTALGQEEGSAISLSQSFRIGVSVIVVGTVAHIALPFDLGATPATYLFFGAGIAGFALAHIASMAPQESAGLRDWPRTAAITVAAIVIGSILLAVIAEGKAGEGAAFVVRMVARVITPIVILIAWAIAIVVEGLTYLFLLVASSVRGGSEPVFFTPTMPDFSNVEPGASGNRIVPFWLLRLISWTAVLVAASGIGYILWRSFALRANLRTRDPDEERERMDAEGDLGGDLAAALGALMGRLGRRRSVAPSSPGPVDLNDPRAVALGVYNGLLHIAAQNGLARRPWQTADEFRVELSERYPPEDVNAVTDAFTRTRYGGVPPSTTESKRLLEIWVALRDAAAIDTSEPPGGKPPHASGGRTVVTDAAAS